MIKIWILVVVIGEGFSMVPISTEEACLAAVSSVAVTVLDAYCYEIEVMIPSDKFAPEMAPFPVSKRGDFA